MANRSPSRRLQRRVRVSVAVLILALATAATVFALLSQSVTWLSSSAAFTLLCAFVSTRIVYSELVQNRRDSAADRARQADSYRKFFTERARENVSFADAMARRIASRERSIGELEGTIRLAEKRATIAEGQVKSEKERADEAHELLASLQRQLEITDPDLVDELAVWEGAVWEGAELDTVIDLLHWEGRVIAKHDDAVEADKKKQA